jgi:autotransporter-associated beta strand protein
LSVFSGTVQLEGISTLVRAFSLRCGRVAALAAASLLVFSCAALPAQAQITRALGLDISAWQGNISQDTWNTFYSAANRKFAFLRSSRGGTTGYYNQNDSDNSDGLNTLSQRYDDPYYIQNITRATKAGILTGSYHFNRADITASTLNSNGIANTGTDEANHFLQMAGPWMRPGYMLPVLDLEAGASQHSTTSLSNWAVAFSDRIYQAMGIRPIVYVNSSYANSEVNSSVAASMPTLWIARPTSGDPLTSEPPPALPAYPNVYGVWNPTYPSTPSPAPWKFWQYDTTGGVTGYAGNLDKNVANGGMEFVKDYLVPAIWMNDSSGEWTDMANWNSGVAPVEPVQGPGQVARVGGSWTTGAVPARPAQRLPGVDDAIRGVDGQNDTVVLTRPSANITVTLSTGSHDIRKLYVSETLNISGGSLTVNYIPSVDSTPIAAQFSGAVSLSNAASLSVHTLQVDSTRTFTINGGALTANKINLMPHASTPAKILLSGDLSFTPLANAAAVISNGSGSGLAGRIDLGGGNRTFNVADGSAATDLTIEVPVSNGGLIKTGAGALALTGSNTYAGDTVVEQGSLSLTTSFLANSADVKLLTGASLDLGFAGADLIDALFIDGVSQSVGTWGAVGSGAQFTSPLITGAGLLQVASPADFDRDGFVDGDDLAIWQTNLGMVGDATTAHGDANGDLNVNGGDLLVWQQQFTGPPPAVTAVPEPAGLATLLSFIAALPLLRRRS